MGNKSVSQIVLNIEKERIQKQEIGKGPTLQLAEECEEKAVKILTWLLLYMICSTIIVCGALRIGCKSYLED